MEIATMKSIVNLLEATQKASQQVKNLSSEEKKKVLHHLSDLVLKNMDRIITENKKDLDRMDDTNPKKDRLLLNKERIQGLASSVKEVAELQDPTGTVLLERTLENGLKLQKITVPMGVVGVIYEARPNVTIDVASLCLRSGNAAVLRGGSDAEYTNLCIVDVIHQALTAFGIAKDAVQLLPVDRKFVKEMLEAVKYIDIIIPRGSQELIDFVRLNSKVPTIETGAGVCHTYVHSSADLQKAAAIVVNAKVDRPSVCNSLDTILVDRAVSKEFLPLIKKGMAAAHVEIFADKEAYAVLQGYDRLQKAREEDFGREFLDYKCSVKVVENIDEALDHIRIYSSKHSEAIVAEDKKEAERFLNEVDAAAVYTNASTRFTDGGVFGLGAEIGISTQKLHARGPFALEKLTTEKWIVRGNGQIR